MTTRRKFLQQSLQGAALLSLAPTALWAATAPLQLTILHTNDMHSRIEPFPDGNKREAKLGGMARRAALIAQIRKESPHVLLLDAGDIFQGTPYFNYFGGELEFKLMSQMGYDAATLGNHDFDNGLDGLERMLPHAKFPFLSANYDFSRTLLKNRFQPYKIFRKGPLKIGVFGLGIELKGLVPEQLAGGTQYQDPIGVAKEMVQELQGKGCHLIVCLSHLGYKYNEDKVSDQKLAQAVEGIDLIIGGHTHTFMEQPQALRQAHGHETLIHQVGWAGMRLGRIDYVFEKNKKKVVQDSASIAIESLSSKI
jgi:5'-nucleotidase